MAPRQRLVVDGLIAGGPDDKTVVVTAGQEEPPVVGKRDAADSRRMPAERLKRRFRHGLAVEQFLKSKGRSSAGFQSSTRRSKPPVATCWPSGEKAAANTARDDR